MFLLLFKPLNCAEQKVSAVAKSAPKRGVNPKGRMEQQADKNTYSSKPSSGDHFSRQFGENDTENRLPSLMYPDPDTDSLGTEPFGSSRHKAPRLKPPYVPQSTRIMLEPHGSPVYSSETPAGQYQVPQPADTPIV